jgi:hypothetical protein
MALSARAGARGRLLGGVLGEPSREGVYCVTWGAGRLTDAPELPRMRRDKDGGRRSRSRLVPPHAGQLRSARLKRPSLRRMASQTPGRRIAARGAKHRARPGPPGPIRQAAADFEARTGAVHRAESAYRSAVNNRCLSTGDRYADSAPRTTAPGLRVQARSTAAGRRSTGYGSVSARRLPRNILRRRRDRVNRKRCASPGCLCAGAPKGKAGGRGAGNLLLWSGTPLGGRRPGRQTRVLDAGRSVSYCFLTRWPVQRVSSDWPPHPPPPYPSRCAALSRPHHSCPPVPAVGTPASADAGFRPSPERSNAHEPEANEHPARPATP